MQNRAFELLRIPLPRTPVIKAAALKDPGFDEIAPLKKRRQAQLGRGCPQLLKQSGHLEIDASSLYLVVL
jgi:hypothetical protein